MIVCISKNRMKYFHYVTLVLNERSFRARVRWCCSHQYCKATQARARAALGNKCVGHSRVQNLLFETVTIVTRTTQWPWINLLSATASSYMYYSYALLVMMLFGGKVMYMYTTTVITGQKFAMQANREYPLSVSHIMTSYM